MLLQRHRNQRLEILYDLKSSFNQFVIEGDAEETLQMQGEDENREDERREDNTAGEEETTLTTSAKVSLV